MRRPWFLRKGGMSGGWDEASTATHTVLFTSKAPSYHPARDRAMAFLLTQLSVVFPKPEACCS
jgi:hypothetical protein